MRFVLANLAHDSARRDAGDRLLERRGPVVLSVPCMRVGYRTREGVLLPVFWWAGKPPAIHRAVSAAVDRLYQDVRAVGGDFYSAVGY